MIDVPLLDAHVHLWEVDRFEYAWLESFPTLNRDHGLDDYERATEDAGVDGMVFVECTESFDDEVSRQEVEWVESLAREEDRIRGIVAHASLEKGTDARPHLDWLSDRPLVTGVRRIVQEEPHDFLRRPDFLNGIRLLNEYDFTFDLTVRAAQLDSAIALVDQCPEVKFVLDHLGKPGIRDAAWEPWSRRIAELAERENVCCKLSGVLTEASLDDWTYEGVAPYVDHALECFGVDRVLFGGDWPVLRLAADYATWVDVVGRYLQRWSPSEKRALCRENAERIYQLPERSA